MTTLKGEILENWHGSLLQVLRSPILKHKKENTFFMVSKKKVGLLVCWEENICMFCCFCLHLFFTKISFYCLEFVIFNSANVLIPHFH